MGGEGNHPMKGSHMQRPDMSLPVVEVIFAHQNASGVTVVDNVPDTIQSPSRVLMKENDFLCEGDVLAKRDNRALIEADLKTFWTSRNEQLYGPKAKKSK